MLKRSLLALSLISLAACNGGGGGGGSDKGSVRARLIDAPVQGVEYINPDGEKGITEIDGGFYCNVGSSVQFFVGGINLGRVTCVESAKVYPMDLVSEPGVSKNYFDSSSTSAKISLFLLTLNFQKPEVYNVNNFGPDAISIGMSDRFLLDSVDESVFSDNISMLSFINKLRCNIFTAHIPNTVGLDGNGALLGNPTPEVFDSCNDNAYDLDVSGLQLALEGAVIHMEKSIMVHSGIVANPATNLYVQTVGGGDTGGGEVTISLSSIEAIRIQIDSSPTELVGTNSISAKCKVFGSSTYTTAFLHGDIEYVSSPTNVGSSIEMCVAQETKLIGNVITLVVGDIFVKKQVEDFYKVGILGNADGTTGGIYRNKMIINNASLDFDEISNPYDGNSDYGHTIPEIKGSFFVINGEIRWYKKATAQDVAQFGYDYGDIYQTGSNVISLYYYFINANGEYINKGTSIYDVPLPPQ